MHEAAASCMTNISYSWTHKTYSPRNKELLEGKATFRLQSIAPKNGSTVINV
jgi:hypothetical protein